MIHKVDYEVFRYVDDYFVFYNDLNTRDEIIKEFKIHLKEFKLTFNDSKSLLYHKPIITAISVAKQKISDLFKKHLKLVEKEDRLVELFESEGEDDRKLHGLEIPVDNNKKIYFSSNNVITRFKVIIKETEVEYKDIMNFSLSALDKNVASLTKKYYLFGEIKNKERVFLHAFLQILDTAFFLYSVSPRVNSTIRICMIVQKIVYFLKKNIDNSYNEPFNISNKHLVLKKISDEIILILKKNRSSKFIQVETLYLLICMSELGKEYRLPLRSMCDYFNISINATGEVEFNHELNYFSITVLLYYIRNLKDYDILKKPIKTFILSRFSLSVKENWRNDTELTMLLFDTLTCPYLDKNILNHPHFIKFKAAASEIDREKYKKKYLEEKYEFKKRLLTLNEVDSYHIEIIESYKYWFIKWTDFDFGKELEAKKSQEVYS